MIYLLIDRYLQGIPACCVYTNNQQAAQDLTTLLFAQGHKNIALVSPPAEKTSTIEDRLRGFMEAHLVSGAVLNPRHLLTAMLSTLPTSFDNPNQVHHDEHLITNFVADNPDVTAFVASEYNIALLLYETLGKLGKAIPADSAIVCFDSAPFVFHQPLFTHVSQDEHAIGQTVVNTLMAQVRGEDPPSSRLCPSASSKANPPDRFAPDLSETRP